MLCGDFLNDLQVVIIFTFDQSQKDCSSYLMNSSNFITLMNDLSCNRNLTFQEITSSCLKSFYDYYIAYPIIHPFLAEYHFLSSL